MTSFDFDENELLSAGIDIANIVTKLDIGTELDLSYLSTELPNASYEPERYSSLIFRPAGLSTVLITRSGILLFTGGNSIDNIQKTYQRISKDLKNVGLKEVTEIDEMELVNVVSTFKLDSNINLNYLSIELGLENVEYEPEQFPALIYRIENGPVVLIFSTGKVVITGTESTSEVLNAVDTVQEVI